MASSPPPKRERRIEEWLEILRLVWAIDHKLQSVSKHLSKSLGVTGQQRIVIKIVGQFPGISAGEIAELLGVHPSTLSANFKKLVEAKLVERRVHDDDARRAMFYLTARGKLNDSTLAGTAEVAVRRTLEKLPAQAVNGAKTLLSDLLRELDAELVSSAEES